MIKKQKYKIPKSRLIVICICLAVIALLALSLIWAPSIEKLLNINNPFSTASEGSSFKVHFIDVGQGDATVVEFSDGKKLLFDAGGDVSENALEKYFKEVLFKDEVWEFEFVIASHSDTDHIGNMDYVFNNCQVNNVYRPRIFVEDLETAPAGSKYSTESAYEDFIKAVNAESNCNVFFIVDGYTFISSNLDYSFSFYTAYTLNNETADNDFSPITIIRDGTKSLCLTGDASSTVEKEVVAKGVLNNVDIVKAGHHGSKTSTSKELLNALNPSIGVISCGVNSFGHPTAEAITRLADAVGENIYRTDIHSNIIVYLDGEELAVCYGELSSLDSLEWWLVVLCVSLLLFALIVWCLKPTRTKGY